LWPNLALKLRYWSGCWFAVVLLMLQEAMAEKASQNLMLAYFSKMREE